MSTASFFELALLAGLSWPWARLLVDPRRRLARTTPRHCLGLAACLAVAGAVAILVAIWLPSTLHAVAALASLVAAASWWRARPSYGRSRHMPPGSLSITRSIQAMVDRDFYAREARRHGPVFKMQFHRPVVCVVGIERGHELMRRHRESLGPTPLPWNREIEGGFLRYMDDATHDVYSPLFRVALAGPVVAAAEPATRRVARRELGLLAEACAGSKSAQVAPGVALDRIVLVAFARALFGIDEDSPEFRIVEHRNVDLRAQILSTKLTRRSRQALDELRASIERCRRQIAATPTDLAPVCMLQELGRIASGMPDGVCVDNLLFILKIAAGDVRSLLRWLVKMLGDHPRWSDRLRAELVAGASSAQETGRSCSPVVGVTGPSACPISGAKRGPGLADRIVMETLRLEQSEYLHRAIREDFEHDGFVYRAGWLLRLCVRESHRDEKVWGAAATFDPDRFLGQPVNRSQYSPFGFHDHACSGVDLNGMICRVTLEELAAFDCSVVRDGELERDFGHWSHWRPSTRLRIRLTARDSGPPS